MSLRVLAVLVAVVALGGSPVLAQSLADLAKKEEARRKAIPAPAKVYTNKDLNPAPPPSTPVPAPAAAAPAAAAPAAAADASKDAPKEPAKDQAYWGGRMKTLQEELARNEGYAVAMETRVNSLTTDFINRDDPAQRSVIERDRQKTVAELDRLRQAITNGKKAIADLEEEARRAGVPPGWLR